MCGEREWGVFEDTSSQFCNQSINHMLIKLTNIYGEKILVGTENIIAVKAHNLKPQTGGMIPCTKIQSRGAMVETNYVEESVDEIYNLVNQLA